MRKISSLSAFRWPTDYRAAVSLSFDDARPSQIDQGLPVLEGHGVKATFYVTPARVNERLQGWRDAVAAGHEIGNHTLSHPCSKNYPWSRGNATEDYTLERMEQELASADEKIRELLGVTPTTFAYPCGETAVGRGERRQSYVPIVARRYLVGRGAGNGWWNDPLYCDLAHTVSIDGDRPSFDYFKDMIDKTLAAGGWLTFFAHEVGPGDRQTMSTEILDAVCRYCRENAVWMSTVAAVGGYVKDNRPEPV